MFNRSNIAALGAATAIAAGLVLAATPALGEPPVEVIGNPTVTRHVPYGDLSLASADGRRMLYRRVGRAVNEVCPQVSEDGSWYDVQDCRQFAWHGARPQIKRAFDQALSGSTLAMSSSITMSVAK